MKEDSSALIVLPLLALMEHITIVKRFPGGSFMDASQEMICIGLTNIFGSFFSSMPVTGSFSRSTVNAASGAESPLGGVFTGALVLLALQLLTPFFHYIPNASLAAVIVSAVIFTVDFSVVRSIWKSKSE
jgi:sodium-independent sulfate anion transporter 11